MYLLKNSTYYFLLLGILVAQNSFEDFKRKEAMAFEDHKNSIESDYNNFVLKEKRDFQEFKKNVEEKWMNFKYSTSTSYVSYDEDLKSRSIVDFDLGKVTVEVILDDKEDDESLNFEFDTKNRTRFGHLFQNFPKNNLLLISTGFLFYNQNADLINDEFSRSNTKPIFQNLSDKKIFKKLIKVLSEKDDSGKPLLKDQLIGKNGKIISPGKSAEIFAQEQIKENKKTVNSYKAKDGKIRNMFSIDFNLRSDHKEARGDLYTKEIFHQSQRFKIDPAISMSVTETESSFNPKATSHIPAYGLMQLVPVSGARDAYQYVYNKDKFLGKRYLYKPQNNIELGCAYLGKIRHVYFKKIKDDEKAMICTVAAYNTGVGNVSKALTNTTKISPLVKKVNKMSSNKLYSTLLTDLEHQETRDYLKKVWSRKEKYN